MSSILDTHVFIWWFESLKLLPKSHRRFLSNVRPEEPVLISCISLWEVAMLYERGRISLTLPLREWLEWAAAPPLVQTCPISPAVAAEVANLPPTFHRDPADRIIVATTRVHRATLLTCDDRIIKAKIVPTLS